MLKKIFVLSLFIFSFHALSCLRATGSLAVDGEKWKFDSKVEANKEYLFPMGTFILRFTVKPNDKKHDFVYVVEEKKGTTLTQVTKGTEEEVEVSKARDIYAKGNEGQPNSIITVKLTNI